MHFPTDINLLFDAGRKVLDYGHLLASRENIAGWRHTEANQKSFKKSYNKVRKAKKSQKKKIKSNPSVDRNTRNLPYNQTVRDSHEEYLKTANNFLDRSNDLLAELKNLEYSSETDIEYKKLEEYSQKMELIVDQIDRRVLKGESIPNEDKIYSIFEPYTEWLDKGKQPKSVNLGLNICIMEDQFQFILHHHVMRNEVDKDIAIDMVKETRKKYSNFKSCSFDRGFYSDHNKKIINIYLDFVCMPKPGKRSNEEIEEEKSIRFLKERRAHSAVESAINTLQIHGLKRCPDRGIEHFERYVAISVMARNIQRLGSLLLEKNMLQKEISAKAA